MNFSNKEKKNIFQFRKKNMNYAIVRTKLAMLRTFLLFCVSIKALIIFASSKHLKNILIFGVCMLIILTIHYIYIIEKLNNNEIINNVFFDYYPLIIIPIIMFLIYISWKKRKTY